MIMTTNDGPKHKRWAIALIVFWSASALGIVTIGALGGVRVLTLDQALIALAVLFFGIFASLVGLSQGRSVPSHVGENWLRVPRAIRIFLLGR